jgi:hypothetical protein
VCNSRQLKREERGERREERGERREEREREREITSVQPLEADEMN